MTNLKPLITFLHPDLGIGGAERATLDAALALKKKGYRVRILTNHHDPSHCFPETVDGSLEVRSFADSWLPRSLLGGRCRALCAVIRFLVLAVFCWLHAPHSKSDLLFVDQIAAPVPLLQLLGFRVLFYCHFPDLLLTERRSTLKRVYRRPLDWLEQFSTGCADLVLVNSNFTGKVFRETFPSLSAGRPPSVLYPVPDLDQLSGQLNRIERSANQNAANQNAANQKAANQNAANQIDGKPQSENSLSGLVLTESAVENWLLDLSRDPQSVLFVSINRFERKKNVELAVKAFARLIRRQQIAEKEGSRPRRCRLIVAGGFDSRVQENIDYLEELQQLAADLQVDSQIIFLRSISLHLKVVLLSGLPAGALLYTPSEEHFGIVPLEAMFLSCPVVAINSGGPRETVVDGQTGFLVEADEVSFEAAMWRFVEASGLKEILGREAHQHVLRNFSPETYSRQLVEHVESLLTRSIK